MAETVSKDQKVPQTAFRKQLPWLVLTALVGLGLAVTVGLYSSRMMMRPSSAGAAQLAAAQSGTVLNIAVEVTAVPSPDLLDAQLLIGQGSNYIRTSEMVQIQLQPDTQVSMGNKSELRPGAILQVSAVKRDPGRNQLAAKRLVILTGYVQVH
ncbi:MAG: hypothetical protein ACRER7_02305 [Gammaproteobacteria bacterium]